VADPEEYGRRGVALTRRAPASEPCGASPLDLAYPEGLHDFGVRPIAGRPRGRVGLLVRMAQQTDHVLKHNLGK
jgi:hypothetical protein